MLDKSEFKLFADDNLSVAIVAKIFFVGKKTLWEKEKLLVTSVLKYWYKCFENTVGKGEIAHYEQFLFFPQCFLLVLRTFCHLYQI